MINSKAIYSTCYGCGKECGDSFQLLQHVQAECIDRFYEDFNEELDRRRQKRAAMEAMVGRADPRGPSTKLVSEEIPSSKESDSLTTSKSRITPKMPLQELRQASFLTPTIRLIAGIEELRRSILSLEKVAQSKILVQDDYPFLLAVAAQVKESGQGSSPVDEDSILAELSMNLTFSESALLVFIEDKLDYIRELGFLSTEVGLWASSLLPLDFTRGQSHLIDLKIARGSSAGDESQDKNNLDQGEPGAEGPPELIPQVLQVEFKRGQSGDLAAESEVLGKVLPFAFDPKDIALGRIAQEDRIYLLSGILATVDQEQAAIVFEPIKKCWRLMAGEHWKYYDASDLRKFIFEGNIVPHLVVYRLVPRESAQGLETLSFRGLLPKNPEEIEAEEMMKTIKLLAEWDDLRQDEEGVIWIRCEDCEQFGRMDGGSCKQCPVLVQEDEQARKKAEPKRKKRKCIEKIKVWFHNRNEDFEKVWKEVETQFEKIKFT